MPEFVLLFRMDIVNDAAQPSPAQMEAYMTQWQAWIESISALGCAVQGGNHFSRQGTVLTRGAASSGNAAEAEGPYVANNVSVAGYLLLHAPDREHALDVARKCPILHGEGTSVEVRETANPG